MSKNLLLVRRLLFASLLLITGKAFTHPGADPHRPKDDRSAIAFAGPAFRPLSVSGAHVGTPVPAPLPSNFYEPKVDFATAALPYFVTIGDLDGDGKADMVTANANANSISVFRNTSTTGSVSAASFADKIDFATGDGPLAVAIGDVDGDGKADIVVANERIASVSVYRNTSTAGSISAASFAAPVSFATGEHPYSVALGDLDGDGKTDITVANSQSNTVSVLRNTSVAGSTSFAARTDFAAGANPRFVAVGDVDGDGKADIAIANEQGATVSVLRNTATSGSVNASSFASKIDYTTGANPIGVAIGDIDGDSKADLAVANLGSNSVSVFRNTATAGTVNASSFAAKVDYATSAQPFSIALGDVDGDGKRDIAVANSVSSGMSILHNNAIAGTVDAGSFDANVQFATGGYPLSVALGDLDGDGHPEVVTSNGANTVSVFRTNSFTTVVPATPPVVTSFSPATGPIGGTVTITGTSFNSTPSNNTVYFGAVKATVTGGTSTTLTVLAPAGTSFQPISVLNTANGLTGYASRPFGTTFVNPYGNNIGTNAYLPNVAFATGTLPYAVAYADLDGDGKTDLAVVNSKDNTVSILQNMFVKGNINTSSLSARVSFATGSDPRAMAIGDVDGDGKPDLVVCNIGSSTISVFRNTTAPGAFSTTSFAPGIQYPTGTQPFSVAIGDIDGDGKPDLVTANLLSGTISLLRNTASTGNVTASSFASRADVSAGSGPRSVAVGDIDGDGKVDIAVALQTNSGVAFFRNTATPGVLNASSLVNSGSFATTPGTQSVVIGDINADGKPEVIVGSYDSHITSFFRNTATPGVINFFSFDSRYDIGESDGPLSLSLGDADGDGKADIFSPRYAGNGPSRLLIYVELPTTGKFTSSSFTGADYFVGGYLTSTAVVDLDGDGAAEYVAVDAASNSLRILKLNSPIGFTAPRITSVTPATGPVGTSLTINGASFNATPAGNAVYLGAIKAVVTTASPNKLIVSVPNGATYEPVSVTNTGTQLVGSSSLPFVTTFTNPKGSGINADYYSPKVDLAVQGQFPYSVALGDIDGDGKPDLVSAITNAGYVSVQRNVSATGTVNASSFAAPVYYTTANPFAVKLKDVDGDGKLDIVTVNLNGATVSVLRNTAVSGTINSSSFAGAVEFGTGNGTLAYTLSVYDVDGDGRPEILFANATSNTVSILRNTSTAGSVTPSSFSTKIDIPTGAFPRSIAMSDIDGDSQPDLVVVNQNDNTVSIFRNIASAGTITSGSFAARVDFAVGTEPGGLNVGDLDGDGKADIAVINHGSNTISVFRNTAAAGTITATSLAARVDFATGSEPYASVIADADGDGKPDLIVANSSSGSVSVLRNLSVSGTISASSFAAKVDFAAGRYLLSITAGDIDDDGIPEIITGSASASATNYISIFSAHAPVQGVPTVAPIVSSFLPQTGMVGSTVTISGTNFNTVPAGNIVYFGAVKATVTSSTTTKLTVTVPAGGTYQSISVVNSTNGLAGYSSKPFVTTFTNPYGPGPLYTYYYATGVNYTTGAAPYAVVTADIDNDGKPEIITANAGASTVSVLHNTTVTGPFTSASFDPAVNLAMGTTPYSVTTGDIDGDGKLDIIATSGSMVSIFRNISTPGAITTSSFAARVDFATGISPFSVVVGDLDQDGKPEIAVANTGSNTISVLRNTSVIGSIDASSFAPKLDLAISRAGFVAISDVDGDGKPDIVGTVLSGVSRFDGSLYVFRNISVKGSLDAGSFATPNVFGASQNSGCFSIFDIDGDEKPEVTYSSPGNHTAEFLHNLSTTGNISLQSSESVVIGDSPQGQAVGDIDGDGKPDLIVCNYAGNAFLPFRNVATAGTVNHNSFESPLNVPTGSGPVAATVGDLDGDGIPEVIVCQANTSTISVFRTYPSTGAAAAAAGPAQLAVTALSEKAAGDLQLYPNPTNGVFTLQLSGMNVTAGSMEILNESGKTIERRSLNFTGSRFTHRLSLANQPAGIYYVKIITTKGVQIAKVVVQK